MSSTQVSQQRERMTKLRTEDNSEQKLSISTEFRGALNGLAGLVSVRDISWIRNLRVVVGTLPTISSQV